MTNAIDRYGAPVASAYVPRTPESTGEIPKQVAANGGKEFFGKDGPSFGDVLDAINPLNQIPFVGDAVNKSMDHEVSTGAKLIGGALIGGPIGFVAGLINAVFEQATGKGIGESMVAALTGDDTAAETQVASAKTDGDVEVAQAQQVPVSDEEGHDIELIAMNDEPVIGAKQAAALAPAAKPMQVADISSSLADMKDQAARDQAVLSLYGSSPTSAHNSYKKAQMLPYLQDVTVSKVL